MIGSGTAKVSRQQEAGAASRAETRRRLLEAAASEFAARGYAAATVARIAAAAGVTVQTLYLAWGSKRALLRAYMEASLAGQPPGQHERPYAVERPRMVAEALVIADGDARALLRQISRLHRLIAERAALGWLLYRDAAATDPEVAADWRALQTLRRETMAELVSALPPRSLRPGITRAKAVDTTWAIASPETYDLLVRTASYELDDYERWVTTTLTAALLPNTDQR